MLVSLSVSCSAAAAPRQQILSAAADYLNVVSSQFERAACGFELGRPDAVTAEPVSVPKIEQQKSRMRVTFAIAQAKTLADRGDFATAKTTMQPLIDELVSSKDDYVKELVHDLRQCAVAVDSSQAYKMGGEQMCANTWQSHSHQRSNQPSKASYLTSAKAQMRFASSTFQ